MFKDWKINLILREYLIYIYIQLGNNINQSCYSYFKIKYLKAYKLFDLANLINNFLIFILNQLTIKKLDCLSILLGKK